MKLSVEQKRRRRHRRVRGKVHGSAGRPRLCVFRSSKGIYAQVIFPNVGAVGAIFRILNPQGPDSIEMWSYVLVDKKAPTEVKEAMIAGRERSVYRLLGTSRLYVESSLGSSLVPVYSGNSAWPKGASFASLPSNPFTRMS